MNFGSLTLGLGRPAGGGAVPAAPPVLSAGSLDQTALGVYTATGSISTTSGDGTIYLVGVESADMTAVTAPSVAEIKAGQKSGGAAADSTATLTVTDSGAQAIGAVGTLGQSTVQRWFAVHSTDAGDSEVFAFEPFASCVSPVDYIGANGFFFSPHLGSAIYQEHDSDTTPATADGDAIGRIYDWVSGTMKAAATASGTKGTLKIDGNGRKSLRAEASYFIGDTWNPQDNRHMSVAAAINVTTVGTVFEHGLPYDAGATTFGMWLRAVDNIISSRSRGTSVGFDTALRSATTFQVRQTQIAEADGSTSAPIFIDGGSDTSTNVVPYSAIASQYSTEPFGLFGRGGGTSQLGGDVYAILVADANIDAGRADIAFLLNCIAGVQKGGAALPDPVKVTARPAAFTSAEVTASGDQLVVTQTLSAGSGTADGHVFDGTKFAAYARENGYGPLTATYNSSSWSGSTTTITLDLDRTVNSGEIVAIETEDGWWQDARGNYAAGTKNARKDLTTITNSSTQAAPATSTMASWRRCWWEISAARPLSFYALGVPNFDLTLGGVNVRDFGPAPVVSGQGTLQKNPFPGNAHGVDARDPQYSAALNIAGSLPVSAADGDCFVTCVPNQTPDIVLEYALTGEAPNTRRNWLDDGAWLHFSTRTAASTEIAPPPVLPDSGVGRLPHKALPDTLANIATALPTYTKPASSPAIGDVEYYASRTNFGVYQVRGEENRRRCCTFGASARDNYGEEYARVTEGIMLALVSDFAAADKQQTLLWTMSHAYWLLGGWGTAPGSVMVPGGGITQGLTTIMAFGMKALAFTGAEISAAVNRMNGGEIGQDFEWTSGELAKLVPHDAGTYSGSEAAKFMLYQRRTVSSVSGLTVTVPASSLHASEVIGCLLTRESDGASATITNYSGSTFTINAQPSPAFAASDVIHVASPYTISVGNYDWWIAANGNWSPMPQVRYRPLQVRRGGMLALKAYGALDGHEASYGYGKDAETADFPAVAYNYPSTLRSMMRVSDGSYVSFASAFNGLHGATIDALP